VRSNKRRREPIMKKAALLMFLTLLSSMSIFAAKSDTVTVESGQSKISSLGKIKVKFISVEEDSRCPEGTNCVWAGNAKVKITLAKGRKQARTFELNSTNAPKVVTFEGYDISFVDLTPHRTMSKVMVRVQSLTVSITKHQK
jgi:hypothetical protein